MGPPGRAARVRQYILLTTPILLVPRSCCFATTTRSDLASSQLVPLLMPPHPAPPAPASQSFGGLPLSAELQLRHDDEWRHTSGTGSALRMQPRRLSWRPSQATPTRARAAMVRWPPPSGQRLGGPRQRFGHPLAALSGDASGVKLRERARCSVTPASAAAPGQCGELCRRVVVHMLVAPPR